jgi:hypothetical protein
MVKLRNSSLNNWIILGFFILITAATAGLGLGYIHETEAVEKQQAQSSEMELRAQFDLGKLDFYAGRYDIALQRFEFILGKNPDYPEAMDYLTQVLYRIAKDEGEMVIDISRPQATSPPTLTPTPDNRAVDEIFSSAIIMFENEEWRSLGKTLLALRNHDPLYKVNFVDRMMYVAHYFNGLDKIRYEGDLEGGLYELSLAELFAPLDTQAETYRNWARIYQIGMSFWYVYPDRSAYYFAQLASAAPYLQDLSGVPAITRYRLALVMYGEILTNEGDWCNALEQFELAQGIYYNPELEPKIQEVEELCRYSIATPTLTPSLTITLSPSPTEPLLTWTATIFVSHTATLTSSLTPTITKTYVGLTSTPSLTPTLTETTTLTPSPTQAAVPPTQTASPTATSQPTETTTPTNISPTSSNTVSPTPSSTINPTTTPTPSTTPEP